jgi:serine/threonine protein kinase
MTVPPIDEEGIFNFARKLAPSLRPEYLRQVCYDDEALRERVQDLLRAHDEPKGFLLAAGTPATVDSGPAVVEPGAKIGPYTLGQKLGEGGMGVVHRATQEQTMHRTVALKVIKPGMDSAQVIARFEAERQALALMSHPNIASVLDGGATGRGLPYFVMELVEGVPITTYCDAHRLSVRERLELFVPVCQAIQHAHQKSIIHRDVKPSNVLVALPDGKPVPKVIDFGVAKATHQHPTDGGTLTVVGAAVGTVEYMAPEQAEVMPLGVDTRSDIYSLGVLLYELLAGTTPLRDRLRRAAPGEVYRVIREEEPSRPSTQLSSSGGLPALAAARKTEPAKLARLVRGELDWIVMRCLEKDRTRRYETANALARDLQRYLADEPVEAGPPSTTYRLRKLARKHRAALAVCGAFVLLLLAGMVVSTWQAVRATLAEQREHAAAAQMKAERDRAQMALTHQVAGRLDGETRQLAMVGDVVAAALARSPKFNEVELRSLLTDLLKKIKRIHGITLAYQCNEGLAEGKYYSLYVHRTRDSIEGKPLPEDYDYPKWDWYWKPIKFHKSHWGGPSFDVPSNVWMVGYSVPMWRDGKEEPVGVLCIDLELEYFTEVWGWLKELNLGKKSYGFVVNGKGCTAGKGQDTEGVFLSHRKYGAGKTADRPPKKITELEATDPAFTKLTGRILNGETGQGTAIDPDTGKRSTFLFTPVSFTGWVFVAVVED